MCFIRFASYTTNSMISSADSDHSNLLEEETSLSITTHMSTLSLPATNRSRSNPSPPIPTTASNVSPLMYVTPSKKRLPSGVLTSTLSTKMGNASKHYGNSAKIVPVSNLRTPILNMSAIANQKVFIPTSSSVNDHMPMPFQLRTKGINVADTTSHSTNQSATHRGYFQLRKLSVDEREDNRKNESSEKRKKEEKAKVKTEKDLKKVI